MPFGVYSPSIIDSIKVVIPSKATPPAAPPEKAPAGPAKDPTTAPNVATIDFVAALAVVLASVLFP
jgi:hypothetical protein